MTTWQYDMINNLLTMANLVLIGTRQYFMGYNTSMIKKTVFVQLVFSSLYSIEVIGDLILLCGKNKK